jgi:arginyl-tRNA synthetase
VNTYKQLWRRILSQALAERTGQPADPEGVVVEIPPRPELGDLAFPMFPYARLLKADPKRIAVELASSIRDSGGEARGRAELEASGPYLNVRLKRPEVIAEVLEAVLAEGDRFGANESCAGQRVIVEFSSPNTNKPLHLGHLRNDSIGMAVARIMEACGAEVRRVNLINDRGIHICKSMRAYREFGQGRTPESLGQKSDHLVGDYYVRFAQWARENPQAEELAQRMLRAWEEGDPEVRALWQTMNRWAIEGINQTYRKTGVRFDQVYLESETYLLGRAEILAGLERGLFSRDQDGSVWADLSAQGLDRKVLLRSDGTSLYVTQDVGTAVQRHRDWPFDQMIYVVGNEQRYHFQVLFQVLRILGHAWAGNLHHLAYGMVNLPEGKMKSREGTVVDADELIAQLEELAAAEIRAKEREGQIENLEATAEAIALGALNFYLLAPSPYKDMVFDPGESISFTGATGPYLQYTGARISSMLRKFGERQKRFRGGRFQPERLDRPEEWELVKALASFPEVLAQAARELNPSLLATHLFELARAYSSYYHDYPVLQNEDADLVVSRIHLARALRQALGNGLALIGVPFLQKM